MVKLMLGLEKTAVFYSGIHLIYFCSSLSFNAKHSIWTSVSDALYVPGGIYLTEIIYCLVMTNMYKYLYNFS